VKRTVIGIPTQTLEGAPGHLPRSWIVSQRYVRALIAVGAVPWIIPLIDDDPETLRSIYDQLDGLFLMGGVDVDPGTYGDERHPMCERSDLDRDRTELMLVRWTLEDQKPVLGVCRGLQLLNVLYGGTLWQDIASERPAI
jgi:putative glutamine amidotransferase